MALSVPVDASKTIASIEDRTWRVQIECLDRQPYTLQFFREDLASNAIGDSIGTPQRTDDFTITLQQLQVLAATHPELQKYFAIPDLIKGLCDALAVILRQQAADAIASARLAELENQG
jgi:hypothetical protein